MNPDSVSKIITDLAVVLIPIIGALFTKFLAKNKKAQAFLEALEPICKDAVTAAQALGTTKVLSGDDKMSKALTYAQDSLTKLGFTKADEQTIKNALEHEFAQAKAELEDTYPQATRDTVATTDTDATVELATTIAQAVVQSLQGNSSTTSDTTTSTSTSTSTLAPVATSTSTSTSSTTKASEVPSEPAATNTAVDDQSTVATSDTQADSTQTE